MTEPNPVYSAFIESELKAERDRKTSLDNRGGNLVASSATLFALLAGVGSIGKAAATSSTPALVPPLLILALVSYFGAALLGIAAQWNRPYDVTKVEGLELLISDFWADDEDRSRRRVARSHIDTIESLRNGSRQKEILLRFGYGCQIIATFLLGPVVFLLIVAR